MIQRDFILRQIHQLAQVLAEVLFQKRHNQAELALETISHGLIEVFGLDLKAILQVDREGLLTACSDGDVFSGD